MQQWRRRRRRRCSGRGCMVSAQRRPGHSGGNGTRDEPSGAAVWPSTVTSQQSAGPANGRHLPLPALIAGTHGCTPGQPNGHYLNQGDNTMPALPLGWCMLPHIHIRNGMQCRYLERVWDHFKAGGLAPATHGMKTGSFINSFIRSRCSWLSCSRKRFRSSTEKAPLRARAKGECTSKCGGCWPAPLLPAPRCPATTCRRLLADAIPIGPSVVVLCRGALLLDENAWCFGVCCQDNWRGMAKGLRGVAAGTRGRSTQYTGNEQAASCIAWPRSSAVKADAAPVPSQVSLPAGQPQTASTPKHCVLRRDQLGGQAAAACTAHPISSGTTVHDSLPAACWSGKPRLQHGVGSRVLGNQCDYIASNVVHAPSRRRPALGWPQKRLLFLASAPHLRTIH